MPTVTVEGNVTLRQAATALRDRLGNHYEVTTHGSGAGQALKVKQSAAATATVHLDWTRTATPPRSTSTAAAWSSRAWSTSSASPRK